MRKTTSDGGEDERTTDHHRPTRQVRFTWPRFRPVPVEISRPGQLRWTPPQALLCYFLLLRLLLPPPLPLLVLLPPLLVLR